DAKWSHEEVAISGGQSYSFRSWYKSNKLTSFNVRYRLNNGQYSYIWLGDVQSSSQNWREFSSVFTVPANAVGLTVFQALGAKGNFTIDDYELYAVSSNFSQPMVSLVFDDGWKSIYEKAIPILDSAGIKSTQYIVSDFLGENSYMTQDDVLAMAVLGHEIGAHSRTHAHLTQLNASQLQSEVVGNRDDLQAMGFDPVTFTYPYGEYNDVVIQAVKDAGYVGARSVDVGFNIPSSNRYVLKDQHVESGVTVSDAKQWIDEAIASKQWLIIELHEQEVGGGQYSNNPAVLQGIVDYLLSTGVQTVTVKEGIGLME
ncbi:MAG: polysaccharide deacetylase family protein, partial [Candidatus Moranbacteria bacterium]|nr:polysaccharide deacetylase family protein [Candidatus Moranbacteria bacterium]